MTVLFSNNATTTLAATANTSATAVTVASGAGALFPAPVPPSDYFYATLVNASNQMEIVKCTQRVSDTLTVVRAQQGTSALSFNIGDKIELRVTAGALQDMQSQIIQTAGIADGAITNPKLAANAVSTDKITNSAVTGPKIQNGSVDNSKLAAGAAVGNIGFTPVQQNGGTGHASSKLYLGWTGVDVTLQVDATVFKMMIERVQAYARSGGYRGIPQFPFTGSVAIGWSYAGCHLYHSDGAVAAVTIPLQATVPFDDGSWVKIVNGNGAGNVAILPDPGVTMLWAGNPGGIGARTLGAQGVATIMKLSSDVWIVEGHGLS